MGIRECFSTFAIENNDVNMIHRIVQKNPYLCSMTDKALYPQLLEQLKALIEGESNRVAVLSNAAALLHDVMDYFWVGFYLVDGDELILGPFQGPIACFHIKRGRGVCGTAWDQARTLVVPDVEAFPGHIACSSLSRSEIVVPVYDASHSAIVGVLDIDSKELAAFDETDKRCLEQIVEVISRAVF